MSLICSRCGSSDVGCHALVNPNNNEIINFSEDLFEDSYCMECDDYTILFEPQKVKDSIRGAYHNYVLSNKREPHFALCNIIWKDSGNTQHVKITMAEGHRPDRDSEVFFHCKNLDGLLALVNPDNEDFVLLDCTEFDIWDDVNIFEFEIDGEKISISEQEIRKFYGKHHPLSPEDIEQYAAGYAAHCKLHNKCNQWLDTTLIKQMIENDETTAKGTKVSFKVKPSFTWFVEILWEHEECTPYKYSLKAYCLDNPQGNSRRFISIEKALLHCLNDFNENACLPNMYNSMEEFWANSTLYERRLNLIRNQFNTQS